MATGRSQQKSKPDGPKKAGVRFHNEVRVKNIKAKGKSMSLSAMYDLGEDESDEEFSAEEEDDDEEDDDEEAEGEDDEFEDEEEGYAIEADEEEDEDIEMDSQSEDDDEDTRETIERLKDDLFADDDDEPQTGMYNDLRLEFAYLIVSRLILTRKTNVISPGRDCGTRGRKCGEEALDANGRGHDP